MLSFPNKVLRASIIWDYVRAAGHRGVVCFSCGHATEALAEVRRDGDPPLLAVAPAADLLAQRWWSPAEIRQTWPDYFDATPGHLPAHLMVVLAGHYRAHLGVLTGHIDVPTGSGETIICLRWAYPFVEFIPVYGVAGIEKATQYAPAAALNGAVDPADLGETGS